MEWILVFQEHSKYKDLQQDDSQEEEGTSTPVASVSFEIYSGIRHLRSISFAQMFFDSQILNLVIIFSYIQQRKLGF